MENIIYWNDVPVGIDCVKYISWFPSASAEAIAQLSGALVRGT
jgi:hypothetical protein